jgi:hypothetical protein
MSDRGRKRAAELLDRTFQQRFVRLVGLEAARDEHGIARKRAAQVLDPIHWALIRSYRIRGSRFSPDVGRVYVRADELLMACICIDEAGARPGEATFAQVKVAWMACGWDRYALNQAALQVVRGVSLRAFTAAGGIVAAEITECSS